MFVFSSFKDGVQTIYERHLVMDDGTVASHRTSRCPLVFIEHEGREYIILYNDHLCPIADVFDYLNFDMTERPSTSRKQAAMALRILYCYLELSNLDVNTLDAEALRGLIRFIRGVGTAQEQFKMETIRSNKTVNLYLATYRSFCTARGIQWDALFQQVPMYNRQASEGAYANNFRMKANRHETAYEEKSIPKYVSPDEFSKLYKLVMDKKDLTAAVIMRLGYGYGLRLGEILGLTLEDITEIKYNGEYVPVLLLRNRLSDKNFQFAKNLTHPTDPRQYFSRDYRTASQRIIISEDMYEWLLKYINKIHSSLQIKYPANYKTTVADVTGTGNSVEENHYVFLNRYGKVLSGQTWGNHVKKHFQDVGIHIDYDRKESNLSHRFRHGFAMFHAHYSQKPWTALKLQHAMRHRSIRSTLIYYNLTEKAERDEKAAMQAELYEMIPELKLLPDNEDWWAL